MGWMNFPLGVTMSFFWVWRSPRYFALRCTEDVCTQVRQTPACPWAYGTYGDTQFLWGMCSSLQGPILQACVREGGQGCSWEKPRLTLASSRLHRPHSTLLTCWLRAETPDASKLLALALWSVMPSSSASHLLSHFWKSDFSCECSAYGNLLLTLTSQSTPCGMYWEPAEEQGGTCASEPQ